MRISCITNMPQPKPIFHVSTRTQLLPPTPHAPTTMRVAQRTLLAAMLSTARRYRAEETKALGEEEWGREMAVLQWRHM